MPPLHDGGVQEAVTEAYHFFGAEGAIDGYEPQAVATPPASHSRSSSAAPSVVH